MEHENLIYLLELIANAESGDIEGDELDVVWEDENGMEVWCIESITEVARLAANSLTEKGKQIEALRELVARMNACLTMSGERAEPGSLNPIRAWLADAEAALNGGKS